MVRRLTARKKFGREDKSAQMYTSIRAKMLSRAKISRRCSEATLWAKGLETRARADPFVQSLSVKHSPPTINSVTTATMIAYSGTQSLLGARAPTQPNGLAFADQNTFQATLDERTCGYGV